MAAAGVRQPPRATVASAAPPTSAPSQVAHQSTYTRESFGQGHPESFNLQFGVSVEQQFLGRRRVSRQQKEREAKARAEAPVDKRKQLVTVEHYFGARLVTLHSDRTDESGRFNAALLASLRKTLAQLETNPAVTVVLLRGATDSLFAAGASADKLRKLAADPAGRAAALAYITEAAKLAQLMATFTKPLVGVVQGAAVGAGASVGALGAGLAYATPSSALAFPEAGQGLVPYAGASYHLSRLPDGLGLYLALTGATLKGMDAYWAGLTGLFGKDGVADTLLEACGALSSDPRVVNGDMAADPVYARALAELRTFRADTKMYHVSTHLDEDVSKEAFMQYLQLKRWYAFIAAGDKASAAACLESPEGDVSDPGDLFDFEASEAINGRDAVTEPAFAAARQRAMIGATSGHAAAVRDGVLDSGPTSELLLRLRVIKAAFAGDPAKGDALVPAQPPPLKPTVTRPALLAKCTEAAKANGPLPSDWETRGMLPAGTTLEMAVLRVYERTEGVPLAAEVPLMTSAVRAAVPRAWQSGGALAPVDLEECCHSAGVPARQSARDAVSIATSYVVAKLNKLPTPWALVDPAPVARLLAEHSAIPSLAKLTLPDTLAKNGITVSYTPKGEVVLTDEEGVEWTPKLWDDVHELEYGGEYSGCVLPPWFMIHCALDGYFP